MAVPAYPLVRRRGEQMDEAALKAFLQGEIRDSLGSELDTQGSSEVTSDREMAYDLYYGHEPEATLDGRSGFTLTEVADAVEWLMPGIMDAFGGQQPLCEFYGLTEEADKFAREVTDTVHHDIFVDNDGYEIIYDWTKDALLLKNGVIKVFWEDGEYTEQKILTGLDEDELKTLEEDDSVEFVEVIEFEEDVEIEDPLLEMLIPETVTSWDVTIRRLKEPVVRIECVPPEEHLISRRATSTSREKCPFQAQRYSATISELIEMGFDGELVRGLTPDDAPNWSTERLARLNEQEEWPHSATARDPASREVFVYECYWKIDFDGDGIAEYRKIIVAGPDYTILYNEQIDDNPFIGITPTRMPHKYFGRSVADQVGDIQFAKTAVMRQIMDNAYMINNSRLAVSPHMNLDDVLDTRIGAPIRADADNYHMIGDIRNHVYAIPSQPIIQDLAPVMDVLDGVRRNRIGVDPNTQDVGSQVSNETMGGLSMLITSAQRRQSLITELFGMTGMKRLCEKVFKLEIENRTQPRRLRLNGEWATVDPRSWKHEMKVRPVLGVASGTREQRMTFTGAVINHQAALLKLQGGTNGPYVTGQHLFNSFSDLVRDAGKRDPERYMANPSAPGFQPPQPQPDPKLIEVQVKAQIEQKKLQLEERRLQIEEMKVFNEIQVRARETEGEEFEKADKAYREGDKAMAEVILENRRLEMEERRLAIEDKKLDQKEREIVLQKRLADIQAQAAVAKAKAEIANDEARTELQTKEYDNRARLEERKQKTEEIKAKAAEKKAAADVKLANARAKEAEAKASALRSGKLNGDGKSGD